MTHQPNISIFDFEGQALRITDLNGEPWFVLADVCRMLDIKNPSMAAKVLDDDERSKFNLGRQGEVIIVSESGLHWIVIRSDQAATPGTKAYRVRKWLTGEVLPAIRRTGRYVLIEPEAEPESHETEVFGLSLARVNAASRLIACARSIYGERAARRLWESEPDLPQLKDLAAETLPALGDEDPAGCVAHLMRHAAGNGQTVKALFLQALHDGIAAGRLKRMGISVDPKSANGFVAFACQHPALADIFAGTIWTGDWKSALGQLPGARPTVTKMGFGASQSKAVLVPRTEIMGMIYG